MQLRMRELVQEALSVHANVASNIQYQIAVVDVGEPLLGGKSSYASVELGIEHVAEPGRHQGRVGKAFFHAMCSIRQIKRSADVLQLERCLSHKMCLAPALLPLHGVTLHRHVERMKPLHHCSLRRNLVNPIVGPQVTHRSDKSRYEPDDDPRDDRDRRKRR